MNKNVCYKTESNTLEKENRKECIIRNNLFPKRG